MEFEKDYLDWVKEVFQFYYIYLKEKEWEKTLMKHTPKESRLRKEYEECIKKVKEYYAEIKKNLEIDEERIQYMFQSFSKDSKCVEANFAGLSLLCYDELHEKSWDEYYEKIRSMTEKEKIETYITILENFEEELKEDEIPQDFNTFVLYLQNSQFDKEICWNILQVFMNQETYFEETVEIIKKTIRVTYIALLMKQV